MMRYANAGRNTLAACVNSMRTTNYNRQIISGEKIRKYVVLPLENENDVMIAGVGQFGKWKIHEWQHTRQKPYIAPHFHWTAAQ